jgi:hypothetical protein
VSDQCKAARKDFEAEGSYVLMRMRTPARVQGANGCSIFLIFRPTAADVLERAAWCPCPSGCATCESGSGRFGRQGHARKQKRTTEQVCRHQSLRPVYQYQLSGYLGDTANESGPALKKHCCSPNHRVRHPTRLREPSQRHRLKGPRVESITVVVDAGQPTRALPKGGLLRICRE